MRKRSKKGSTGDLKADAAGPDPYGMLQLCLFIADDMAGIVIRGGKEDICGIGFDGDALESFTDVIGIRDKILGT